MKTQRIFRCSCYGIFTEKSAIFCCWHEIVHRSPDGGAHVCIACACKFRKIIARFHIKVPAWSLFLQETQQWIKNFFVTRKPKHVKYSFILRGGAEDEQFTLSTLMYMLCLAVMKWIQKLSEHMRSMSELVSRVSSCDYIIPFSESLLILCAVTWVLCIDCSDTSFTLHSHSIEQRHLWSKVIKARKSCVWFEIAREL